MESQEKKKITKPFLLQMAVLLGLWWVAVTSVLMVLLGITPTQLYVSMGVMERPCKGYEGCFSFCNVGNGDGSFVYTDRVFGVVDFGTADYANSFCDKAIAIREKPWDFAVISHPHLDHIGGYEVFLKTIGLKRLFIRAYTPDQLADYALYEKILTLSAEYGVEVIHPTDGTVATAGEITLEFYAPNFNTDEENERCLLTRATIGGHSCLFVGDSGFTTEAYLLHHGYDVDADLLKVGHHGSKNATSPDFLAAVSPHTAIICVGYNRYDHPSAETTTLLSENNIEFYRTDLQNQLIFSVDKNELVLNPI